MHIVVAVDLSSESRRVFKVLRQLAEGTTSTVTLLHIVEDDQILPGGSPGASPLPAPAPRDEIADAMRRLDDLARELGRPGWLSCEARMARKPARAILEYVRQRGGDLVVMATHGRSGLRRLVLGSVTEEVMRHATFPIVCVPPGTVDGED